MSIGELFTALGFLAGLAVLIWAAKERKLATEGIAWLVLAAIAGGILGAKITELVFEGWPLRVPFLAGLDPRAGGRALLGGVIFGWIAVEVAKRRMGITRSTGYLFALALPAGETVGRIGCYLNGCCFGTESNVPWAVYQHGALRHPAQLYSAFAAAAIFVGLFSIRKKVLREADLFRLYLVAFGATRFGLELVRQNETFWLGLTPMQWFCIEITVYGLTMLLLPRRKVATAR